MHLMPLNVDCAERLGRTKVLASSAADATRLVDGWELR